MSLSPAPQVPPPGGARPARPGEERRLPLGGAGAPPSPATRRPTGLLVAGIQFPTLHIGAFIGILHLLIGLVGAGVITAFSLYFIHQGGEQANLREVEDLAFIVDNVMKDMFLSYQSGQISLAEVETVLARYLQNHDELHYAFLRLDGTPYFTPDPTRALPDFTKESPEFRSALSTTFTHSIRTSAQGEKFFYVATAVDHGTRVYGVLVLAAPYDALMAPTYRIMRSMMVIALLLVIFTVVEGWLGSIYISQPVVRLSQVAGQLSQGDLSARAEPEGPVETIHLARTLNEMAARLQTSLNSLRAFVANASHELRTPLTAIKLQVGVLRSAMRDDPEAAAHFLDQIDNEIDRLTYTVNDMLDLSQIEGGGAALNFHPVNLVDLSREVLAFWEARSRQAGLSLALTVESDLPDVRGDPYQLRRLFDNLLDNAIKNSRPGGRVEIHLGQTPAARVRLECRDTGVGIAAEHLPHLFDRFYRIDPRPRPDPGRGAPSGSGLGLAIARSIILAHGGQIGVASQPGCGTTFWVELPPIQS